MDIHRPAFKTEYFAGSGFYIGNRKTINAGHIEPKRFYILKNNTKKRY